MLLASCVRRMRRRIDIRVDESRAASRTLIERAAPRYWLTFLAQAGALLFSILILSRVLVPWLDGLGVNPFTWLEESVPPRGVIFIVHLTTTILLWIGVPCLICALLDRRFFRRPVHRELDRCMDEPACFTCGYSLAGLNADGTTACPECGAPVPHLRG